MDQTSMDKVLEVCGLRDLEIFQLAAIPFPKDVGRMEAKTFTDPDAAEAWAQARSGKVNLYVCGNPLRAHKDRKAADKDVLEARVLLLDCDPIDESDLGFPQDVLGACKLAQALVGGTILDSGRGCQLWIRHEPLATPYRAAVLRELRAVVNEKFPGVKVDGTGDPSRLMRLPGYPNLKTGRVAKFVS